MRALMIPKTIRYYNGKTYYGFSDGFFYKTDPAEYKDLSLHHMTFDLWTKRLTGSLSDLNITAQQFNISGRYGGRLSLNIYANGGRRTPTATYTYAMQLDDDLDMVDMTMDLIDAYFSLAPGDIPTWSDMDINCRSFQARIKDLLLSGGPVYVNNLMFMLRKIPKSG
jgi:hypothetical protein